MAETATVLRGKFAGVDLDELVDWPVVRTLALLGHVLAPGRTVGRRGAVGPLQLSRLSRHHTSD